MKYSPGNMNCRGREIFNGAMISRMFGINCKKKSNNITTKPRTEIMKEQLSIQLYVVQNYSKNQQVIYTYASISYLLELKCTYFQCKCIFPGSLILFYL